MNIWVDANGWPFPPFVLLVCLVAEILYFRGLSVLINAAQRKEKMMRDRGRLHPSPVTITLSSGRKYQWNSWFWRGILFLCSLLVFLLASSALIDLLSARLFWVHMVQHLLLLVVMAPLLVASAPFLPVWLGLPRRVRKFIKIVVHLNVRHTFYRLGHWLRQPVLTCGLLIIGTWVWHWPPLYDLALTNGAVHDWLEHATFLAVSVLFWSQVIPSFPLRPRLSYLGRVGYLGIAIVQNVVLAALLGYAPQSLYAPYMRLIALPGALSTLQDQQFGAGIMWTFGDVPFGIALSILLQHWLASQMEESQENNNAVSQH